MFRLYFSLFLVRLNFFFPFSFLGQANVRSALSVASSLESENSEGERELFYTVFPFSFFLSLSSFLFLLPWRSPLHLFLPLAISLQVLHPLFNLLYVLSQNLRGNQGIRRRRLCLMKLVLIRFSFLFFFVAPLPPFFFKSKSVLPFSFLLRLLIQALEILSLLFLREL